jgi:Putative MetA-pathway of phenol degradation
MEPRAYSRAPLGSQFIVFSYSYQTGDVLLDSSLPLRDVSVKFNATALGYGRTFGLAGRQANVSVVVPYINGRAEGTVFEDRLAVRRSGLGDVRLRLSTILKGGPALRPREFASYKPATQIGASITVVAPTGQYDPRRLVNVGSNRWAFRPEVGLTKPIGRWTMEVVSGIWLFTGNNNFFGGNRRKQKPLTSIGGHVIYTLRPRMWTSVNATYYTGGRTIVNDVVNADVQKNSRVGATFSFPLSQRSSIKVAYAKGVTARFGGHLSTIGVAWQYAWFKR